MIGRIAVVFEQPRAHDQAVIAVVHVHVPESIERRRWRAVDIGAHVYDRGGDKPAIAGV